MIRTEAEARAWVEQLPQIDTGAIERLDRLVCLLSEENTRQNLVSQSSLGEVWRRHVADSAQLLRYVGEGPLKWLDLGTGAGFPGLVISILRPEYDVRLVESRKRRAEWLKSVIADLALSQVSVAGSRLEDVEDGKFDAISARAFAPLDRLLALSARFSTSQTIWLLPKGRSAREELDALPGWSHLFHVEQSLTDFDSGLIVGRLLGRKGRENSD